MCSQIPPVHFKFSPGPSDFRMSSAKHAIFFARRCLSWLSPHRPLDLQTLHSCERRCKVYPDRATSNGCGRWGMTWPDMRKSKVSFRFGPRFLPFLSRILKMWRHRNLNIVPWVHAESILEGCYLTAARAVKVIDACECMWMLRLLF